ncbi:hypothetical protein BGZ63DRAFT_13359 [Mariannaea sp. PMI_226]|nr:hypothetical protein BGZ63DRAFT_13359 [Mariannaea sp. PMI_226]
MAAEGVSEPAAPNLNLTPEEKRVYGQLFRQADNDSVGVVTGEVAVKFFDKTRLDSRVLGEIWQIADRENRGFLTPAGFGIVLRLIGHAQANREPTPELALQQGPIPRFDGLGPAPIPGASSPVPLGSPPPPAALQAQSTGGPIRIPPLTPEKVNQYAGLFERQPLQNGSLLPGDQAKQIFEKSSLPNEVLGRIWQLADTEQRGALVLTEFIIAMHLLTSMKTGALRTLPNMLPAGLYEAAARRSGTTSRQSSTGPGIPPVPAIPRQLSGSNAMRTGSPLGRPPMSPQSTASDWAVTPADKARFDQIYTDLDKTKKGFITGEEAYGFLSQSSLPEDTLAQIWDLSDTQSRGQLSRDEFAVAMYLIRQQRGGRGVPLPATLPANLMPPSLRGQGKPPVASPVLEAPPPPPQPKSALDDLFGLDSSPSPIPAPVQAPMSTGGSNVNDPFAGGSAILTPTSPAKPVPTASSTFKPFVPSSSFGRGLTATPTGGSSGSTPQPQTATEDLLMDNDPEASKNLTGDATELANLSNQIGSLTKQTQEVQAKRATTQNDLAQATSQKQNFEQRLAQLRTLYEKEAADTHALEEKLKTSRVETQKLQAECMTLEGTYKDTQTQHQQVLAALQADQQENTNLRERIRVVNGEIAQLKPQIEKLKSEARQQKGLVAINKKQLSTTEGERDKLKTEVEDLTKSNEDLARQANTGSPASASAHLGSPAASTSSGNNPFFRRTASTDIMGTFTSLTPKTLSDKTFDDVFGPSFSGSTSGTPPPPTSFKPQNTGASSASVGSFSTPPASQSPVLNRQPAVAVDPPAPPESRQISSSFLPFAEANESLSSSRQVSPPASRIDDPLHGSTTPIPSDLAASVNSPASPPPAEDAEKPEPKSSPEGSHENLSDKPTSPPPATAATTSADPVADPFGADDEARAKADFENAFAAFTTTKNKITPEPSKANPAAFNVEFPPISELERDDDSDSASEQGGFDDDFAPASPPAKSTKSSAEKDGADEGGVKLGEEESKPNSTAPSKESIDQPSPPVLEPAMDSQRTAIDDIFGSALTGTSTSAMQPAPSNPPQQSKNLFDDDDDFEGLEDAKEASDEEEFANISRSGLNDFSPVFDSSPPASQAKSESTAFGNESSFDFVSTTSTGPGQPPAGANQQKAPEAHDWDAIFSGLEPASTPATSATPAADKPATTVPAQPQEDDDPILKRLTSMGYQRDQALDALEKYDYDVNKAANFLASQS